MRIAKDVHIDLCHCGPLPCGTHASIARALESAGRVSRSELADELRRMAVHEPDLTDDEVNALARAAKIIDQRDGACTGVTARWCAATRNRREQIRAAGLPLKRPIDARTISAYDRSRL